MNFHNLGIANDFLELTTKAQTIKEKNDMLYFMKIKTFCFLNMQGRK